MSTNELIKNEFRPCFNLKNDIHDNNTPIYCIEDDENLIKFAKFVSNKKLECLSQDSELLIAIYLNHGISISSIAEKLPILIGDLSDNVQIAVCEKLSSDDLYAVKTIFRGKDFDSPVRSIRSLAYYMPDISEETVSSFINTYDTAKEAYGEHTLEARGGKIDTELFPFDLFIPKLPNSECQESIFSAYLSLLMDRDIRNDKYGCKIPNVHVSFEHGIHSDTFYDLAVILHNSEMLDRIALLIARSIFKKYENTLDKGLLLVGYEKQTRLLILKLKSILESYAGAGSNVDKFPYVIYLHDKEGDYLSFAPGFSEKKESNGNENSVEEDKTSTRAVFIMPWSITLTWLSDMYSLLQTNKDRGDLSISPKDSMGICILLEGSGKVGELEYWKLLGGQGNVSKTDAEPCSESANNSCICMSTAQALSEDINQFSIKYLINKTDLVIANWAKLAELASKQDNSTSRNTNESEAKLGKLLKLPSVYPDRTNLYLETVINETMINTVNNNCSEEPSRETVEEYSDRFKKIYGCLRYSHIDRNGDHFRYYLDYRELDKKCEFEINNWLESLSQQKAEKDYKNFYNIILSPLSNKNSRFLNAVVENVFKNNCRLIHIPFDDMDDESIRSRYSYILEELKNVAQLTSNMKVRLYYVYNTVNSRRHISRGLEIYHALSSSVSVEMKNIQKAKYDAVFLLHSNDIDSIMGNYVENSGKCVHTFIKLNIPTGNISFGRCVTCDQLDKYSNLSKSASSSALMAEYHRLSEKYLPRTDRNYDEFAMDLYEKNHSYFAWLKEWVYRARKLLDVCSSPDSLDSEGLLKPEDFANVFEKIHKYQQKCLQEHNFLKDDNGLIAQTCRDEFYDCLNDITIQDLDDELLTKCNGLIKKVVDYRNYLRLKCLNNAYTVVKNSTNATEALSLLLKLICKECDAATAHIEKGDKIKATAHIEKSDKIKDSVIKSIKIDLLISYIKVLSRPPFTNRYYLHHASFMLLKILFKMFDYSEQSNLKGLMEHDFDKYTEISTSYEGNINTKIRPIESLKTLFSLIRGENTFASSQYRLYDCIAQRLADFQDVETFSGDMLDNMLKKYYYLITKHFANAEEVIIWNEIPKLSTVYFDIVRAVKWMSTAHPSKSYCNVLERFINKKLDETSADHNSKHTELLYSLFLENTGMLYAGLEWHKTRGNDSAGISSKLNHADRSPAGRYHDLLEYVKRSKIAVIYALYDLLCNMDESVSKGAGDKISKINDWEYPYKYEEICNKIKQIACAGDCYIVYQKNSATRLCARSSFRIKEDESGIYDSFTTNDFNRYINDKSPITDSVYYSVSDKDNTSLLILEVRLNEGWNKNGSVYIMLTDCKYITNRNTRLALEVARNILCLRNRLYEVLRRDISVLMRFPSEYWYVKKISNKDQEVNILQLSDLHLSDRNFKDAELSLNALEKSLKYPKIKIDLLVITGDVVNKGESAAVLEHNYSLAERFIKRLAVTLWGGEQDKTFLHDWQKRIVIIPGNHDYASMNELAAMSSARTTQVGSPASDEGSTMAKFSYYINFIRRLLDVNVGLLIDNHLYEVRTYKQLDLRLYCANTSSKANMLRNNRFSIETDIMERLMYPDDKSIHNHIILMHHPAVDNYNGEIEHGKYADNTSIKTKCQYIKEENINGELNYIIAAYAPINGVYRMIYEFYKKEYANDEEKSEAFTKMQQYINCPKFKQTYYDVTKLSAESFTRKLTEAIVNAREEPNAYSTNTWLHEAMHSIYKDCEAGIADTEKLKKGTAKIIQKIYDGGHDRKILVLSGHMHRWYNDEIYASGILCPFMSAPKYLHYSQNNGKKKQTINYCVIKLNHEDEDCPWNLFEYEYSLDDEGNARDIKRL